MCQHDPRVRIEQAHVGVPASFSPRGTHRKWGLSVGCKENGRQRPRSLVSRPQQSSLYWALKCTLQIARPAILVSIVLAQLLEPPCTDPYARWCGRGGAARLPPIPIAATSCSGPSRHIAPPRILGRKRGIAEIDRPTSIAEGDARDPKATSSSIPQGKLARSRFMWAG